MPFLLQSVVNNRHPFGPARQGCEFEDNGIGGQALDDGGPWHVVALYIGVIIADYLAHKHECTRRNVNGSIVIEEAHLRGFDETTHLFVSQVFLNGVHPGVDVHAVEEERFKPFLFELGVAVQQLSDYRVFDL